MGASGICPSMGSLVGKPLKVRMRSSTIIGSLRVEESRKTYGEALVREAIIHCLMGRATHTIHYLGHNTSVSAMLDKLNTVYGAVASYNVLMWKFYQVMQERGKSVSDYLICVKEVLNDIRIKFPTWVTKIESDPNC